MVLQCILGIPWLHFCPSRIVYYINIHNFHNSYRVWIIPTMEKTIQVKTEFEWHIQRANMIRSVMREGAKIISYSNAHLTIQHNDIQLKLIRPHG